MGDVQDQVREIKYMIVGLLTHSHSHSFLLNCQSYKGRKEGCPAHPHVLNVQLVVGTGAEKGRLSQEEFRKYLASPEDVGGEGS